MGSVVGIQNEGEQMTKTKKNNKTKKRMKYDFDRRFLAMSGWQLWRLGKEQRTNEARDLVISAQVACKTGLPVFYDTRLHCLLLPAEAAHA